MYYVLLVDTFGTTKHVEKFATRPEAVEYIANLPDDYYMVILRNDNLSAKTLRFE